jgi:O-glycosyl hydrolase
MNKRIFLAVTVTALAALFFVPGCQLAVNDPIRNIPIVSPYISEHPKSASYNIDRNYFGHDELKVVVQGWKKPDGKITYQWYTFESYEEYCENVEKEEEGGTLIPGATKAVYSPDIPYPPTAGDKYFYYVIVTNDFKTGTDKTTASIRSDIAIISFYNNSQAPFPVITRHPVDASYTIGRVTSINPLEVRATADGVGNNYLGTGNITYRWYSNTTFSTTGGTPMDNSDTTSFVPDIVSLKKGPNYFYVEVTNTVTISDIRMTATVTSFPVTISMELGERAADPRITLQPKDQMIFDGNPARALTVAAEPTDGGKISYQWYSLNMPADTATFAGGARDEKTWTITKAQRRLIQGETNTSFTPPPPAPSELVAYFVEVTNTNDDVVEIENEDGTKTKDDTRKVDSNVVTVRTASTGTPPVAAATFVQIRDPGKPGEGNRNRFQYIRGYGGMDVAWANFPNTTEADTEFMYNPDWGLGYNILRIMIVPPGSTQGNYTNHDDIIIGRNPNRDDYNGWNGLILGGQRTDYVRNVQVVNKYNGYVLASPWTPPKEWKTNNSINSGGTLMVSEYQSFANYLRSFCQFMYYQKAPIYAISIANEPNYSGGYDGCEWDSKQMMNFFVKVGQFTRGARGWGGGKSIPRVLIVNGESANTPALNNDALANPVSRAAIDFYARHVYGNQNIQLWKSPYADWKDNSPYNTECWMTEHNINSANALAFPDDSTWPFIWRFMNDIDLVMRLNHENAFVWWASKRFYSMLGDGQYETRKGEPTPRGYGLSHYAKYTIDTTRIDVEIDGWITPAGSSTPVKINVGGTGGNVNMVPADDDFSLDAQDAKITAYISKDGNEISMIMFTPTLTGGGGGFDLGWVEIGMPPGFEIGSVQAHKSWGDAANQLMQPYNDFVISANKDVAYVEVRRSQILSIKFTRKG